MFNLTLDEIAEHSAQNVFCPTGEGGGVDLTCSPRKSELVVNPFVSEAQRRWMFARRPKMAKRWAKHTPKGKKLPERVENGEYQSAQFNVTDPLALERVRQLQAKLDPEDVVELEDQPHITVKYGLLESVKREDVADLLEKVGPVWVTLGRLSLFETPDADVLKLSVESLGLENLNRMVGLLPNENSHRVYSPHLTIAYLKPGTGKKYLQDPSFLEHHTFVFTELTFSTREREHSQVTLNVKKSSQSINPLRYDPSQTASIRRAFEADVKRRFRKLARDVWKLVVTEDAFGIRELDLSFQANVFCPTGLVRDTLVLNDRWRFLSSFDKVQEFLAWLQTKFTQILTDESTVEDDWWKKYVVDGFRKGQGRVFDDVKKKGAIPQEKMPGYQGTREEFLRSSFHHPVSIDKVKLLSGRVFTELKGVTDAMAQAMTRTLTDGLVQGKSPRDVGRDLAKNVEDIGVKRGTVIARTETIRAHAEGQLVALKKLGADRIKAMVEWSATKHLDGTFEARVCDLCRPMDGVVMTVDAAQGLIPRHPNCRCAWVPANVGEDPTGQIRERAAVLKAIKKSLKAGGKNAAKNWGISKKKFTRNVFCPTGKGGGVDPTCSPEGVKRSEGGLDLSTAKFVKTLSGSTGPKLYETPDGKRWVVKEGKSEDHLRNEVDADDAYRALGVPVPASGLTKMDGKTVKYSEYLDGAQTLAEWREGKTQAELQAMHDQIGKHFVADALLANWDVVGLSSDNILIKNGVAYRGDNGGALKYRAQGAPKGSKFGAEVGELKTLKDSSLNASAAKVFKGVTEQQIHEQISNVLLHANDVFKAVKDPTTRKTLEKRIDHLIEKHKEVSGPPKVGVEHLVAHLKKTSEYKFTDLHLQKIAYLNPDGIKDNTFVIPAWSPASTFEKHLEAVKKALPPGVVIKKVHVTQKMLDSGEKFSPSSASTVKPKSSQSKEVQVHGILKTIEVHDHPEQKKWENSLTTAERKSISAWKVSAREYRKAILKDPPPPPKNHKEAATFYNALLRAPLVTGTVWRGVHDEGFSNKYATVLAETLNSLGVGGVWTEGAPHCTSISKKNGLSFSHGEVLLKITTRTGRFIGNIAGFKSELEVVGMPSKYRIKKIYTKEEIAKLKLKVEHLFELEEIPHGEH